MDILNCRFFKVPFVYLDMPIGANSRRQATWKPIVEKYEKKLTGGAIRSSQWQIECA